MGPLVIRHQLMQPCAEAQLLRRSGRGRRLRTLTGAEAHLFDRAGVPNGGTPWVLLVHQRSHQCLYHRIHTPTSIKLQKECELSPAGNVSLARRPASAPVCISPSHSVTSVTHFVEKQARSRACE